MTLAQLWDDYETRNKKSNDAYRSRGCPDCGDIAIDEFGRMPDGTRCRLCKLLRAKETA